MTDNPTRRETDLAIVDDGQRHLASIVQLTPGASRRLEVRYARDVEKIQRIGEIGRCVADEISETERHVDYKAAITMSAADFLDNAAQRGASPAEQSARRARRERYLERMNQIADATSIKTIMQFDQATENLSQRTFADAFQEVEAGLGDILLGRRSLPPSRR
jgi:hypothetical protein